MLIYSRVYKHIFKRHIFSRFISFANAESNKIIQKHLVQMEVKFEIVFAEPNIVSQIENYDKIGDKVKKSHRTCIHSNWSENNNKINHHHHRPHQLKSNSTKQRKVFDRLSQSDEISDILYYFHVISGTSVHWHTH